MAPLIPTLKAVGLPVVVTRSSKLFHDICCVFAVNFRSSMTSINNENRVLSKITLETFVSTCYMLEQSASIKGVVRNRSYSPILMSKI